MNRYIPVQIESEEGKASAKMRIRGDSSREYPKKSLKLKLQKEESLHQKKVFNFNAEYKDPSYTHSYVSSLIFKELNYPCFKSSFAELFINNSFHGLYAEIENMDKEFLMRNGLNPKGDLYKATKDGACLFSVDEVHSKWEKKTNKQSSWTPLARLIEDLQSVPDDEFENYIKSNFDYAYLLNYLAINIFIANGSTYYHNYYLYRDAENNGKWLLLPWDVDKSLSYYNWKPYAYHSTSSDWENDNPLIERCFLNETIFEEVKLRLESLNKVLGEDFYEPILTAIEKDLEALTLRDTSDKIDNLKDWKKAINKERKFLKNRAQKALDLINKFPLSFKVNETAKHLSSPFYLSWEEAADSVELSYEVYVSQDFRYRDTLTTKRYKTKGNRIRIDDSLQLGKYFWKVVAVKGDKECAGFNSKNSFELREGTTLPAVISETIHLKKVNSPYVINDSLIVSKKGKVEIEEGVVVLVGNNAKIKVFGQLNCKGIAAEKIEFRPVVPGGYFHSIGFYSGESKVEHTLIKDGFILGKEAQIVLSNTRFDIKNRIWQARKNGPCVIRLIGGAVVIDSTQLFGAKYGQGMNIISSKVSVTNSAFYNIPDAIEYINVTEGLIANNLVLNSPDDAIDLNGCIDVMIRGNTIVNSKDKGLSIGGSSKQLSSGVSVLNNTVINNGIGLSVKDSSEVLSKANNYTYNKVGLMAYRKNQWFSKAGGFIESDGDTFFYNENTEEVDEYSSITASRQRMEQSVVQSQGEYAMPSQLTYVLNDSSIYLVNQSHLDMNLNGWVLVNEGKIVDVRFTKNDVVPAHKKLKITNSTSGNARLENYKLVEELITSEQDVFFLKNRSGLHYTISSVNK